MYTLFRLTSSLDAANSPRGLTEGGWPVSHPPSERILMASAIPSREENTGHGNIIWIFNYTLRATQIQKKNTTLKTRVISVNYAVIKDWSYIRPQIHPCMHQRLREPSHSEKNYTQCHIRIAIYIVRAIFQVVCPECSIVVEWYRWSCF